jgi:GTP cyclohydrolase IA
MVDSNSKIVEAAELFEESGMDVESIRAAVLEILIAIGEDPGREGLQRTPERVAKAYKELLSGYRVDPIAMLNGAIFDGNYDEMVLVKDIEFYSLCEHHMLPFMGKIHVAYIPEGKIIGLSKIPRIVELFARRLQIQERLTHQIAGFMDEILHPRGTAVVVEAFHLCSMMRGVKKHDSRMVTSAMSGLFKSDHSVRVELFNAISHGAAPLQM